MTRFKIRNIRYRDSFTQCFTFSNVNDDIARIQTFLIVIKYIEEK